MVLHYPLFWSATSIALLLPTIAQAQDVELPATVSAPRTFGVDHLNGGENDCSARQDFTSQPHCAANDAQAGLGLTTRLDPAFGTLDIRASYGQRRDAAFDLHRRHRAAPVGTTEENMLATIGIDATFAGGAVTLKSDLGVNRRSYVPLAASALLPQRIEASNGTSQAHALAVKLLDAPKAKLSLDARYSRSTGLYLPFASGHQYGVFAVPGEEIAVGAKARLGDIGLKARSRIQSSDAVHRDRHDISFDYSGVTVRARQDRFASTLYQSGIAVPSRTSDTLLLGIDIVPMMIVPEIAFGSEGWSALIPTTISIDLSQRQRRIERTGLPQETDHTRIAMMGLWTSPLGDTLLSFDRETGSERSDPTRQSLNQTIMIDHSVTIDGWSLGGNLMVSTNKDVDAEGSTMLFYGLSAKRRFENGIDLRLDIGRDSFDLETLGGAFTLRDKAMTLRLSADFTDHVRARFRRDDLTLRVEGRLEFGESGTELRLFNDIVDSDFARSQGHGFLITLGADLP